MATTIFFDETIRDQAGEGAPFDLEIGTSTFLPETMIYMKIDENTALMDKATVLRLHEQLENAMFYLGYLKGR